MPTVVHMDIPADNVERGKKFYSKLFGWEFIKAGEMEYYLIRTRGLNGEEGIGGGMGLRGAPDQKILNYIGVPSIDDYMRKVEEAGGKVLVKLPVPGMGYLANCLDTENNFFGLWEDNENAK